MATTIAVPQNRFSGTLTREFSSSATTPLYFSSTKTLGITSGYLVINPRNAKAETLKFTAVAGTTTEYTVTIGTRGLRDYGTDTNVSGNQFTHNVGSEVIISDDYNWINNIVSAFNTHEDLVGAFHGFVGIGVTASRPTAVGNTNKLYWSTDDLIMYTSDGASWNAQSAGTVPDASTMVKGIGKTATAPASAANPIFVGDNDPRLTSSANMTDLTDAGDTTLHYHAQDRARGNHTGTQLLATLLETGTAGETLSAGNYVYLKASDGKLYKATNVSSSLNEWNIVGRIVTGGAADVTVTYVIPFTGSFFFTSGLTDGAKYYLGTGGALTTTRPATNSSSTIPVEVGTAAGTTVLVYNIFRIPREVTGVVTVDGSTLNTLTVGFPVKDADFHCLYSRSGSSGHSLSSSVGRYANASNHCVYAWGYSAGASSANGTNTSTAFSVYIGDIADGTGSASAVAAVDGSNNVTLTWTATTFTGAGMLLYKVTEAI